MNELTIIKNAEGKQLVSAKELYLGLGLRKNNWTRWYPVNIERNEYFSENEGWARVPLKEEGNETIDFAISIEFAKHIAMMARTEKSHDYRNYFIDVEEKFKEIVKPMSIEDLVILQAQSVKELKVKVSLIGDKQDKLVERVNNLDKVDITGTPRQQLNSIIRKYALDHGVTYSTAYNEFYSKFNTAYHANLKLSVHYYKTKNHVKNLTVPDYMERVRLIPDGLRIATKMMSEVN